MLARLTSLMLGYSGVHTDTVKLLAKLIKYAKQDNLHSRRLALQYLVNKKKLEDKEGKKILDKLFSDLKERYKDREGGYSRITLSHYRRGDNSLRAIFSLV
jgi:large subunit ribosomal protein L17